VTAQLEASRCAVCGSVGGHGSGLGGMLRRCGACSFTWTAAELASPQELYGSSYFCGSEGYEDYFQPAARRFESGLRLRWLLSSGAISSLVEAGSAGGFFLEAAGRAGIVAEGVEVSGSAVRFAREELGVSVRQACFEDVSFVEPVGVVCAFHVLEHVEDPGVFLRAAFQALEPGGRLALEVPNIASTAARRLGSRWPGLQPQFHRWHFSPGSLIRLVTAHGFEVMTQDTAVFRFYMPVRYRRRHFRHHLRSDLINLGSFRLTHPRRGDLLRLIARRPVDGRRMP
jgi:SAM-dependent methyltransferase